MTVLERKNHIHELVLKINDNVILEKVELFFEQLLVNVNEDWSDNISDQERRAIEAGMADMEANSFVAHDDVKAKALKILNR